MGRKRPVLRSVARISTALDWSGQLIAAGCLGFMFVLLLLNIILRYAFGSGIAWAYEIHALLLPWLVAGGIVIASARSRNIAITILPDVLGPDRRRFLVLAIQVAIFAISISVLQSSRPILKASTFQTLSTLGIKQVWGYASLVYAFGAMAVIAIVDILRTFGGVDVLVTDPEHASLS